MRPRAISLFSGAMGLDLGLEAAGFRTSVVVEINKAAIDTIKLNRPKLPCIDKSIVDVTTADVLAQAGLHRKDVTLVSGGPCCQSFSTAGKRGSVSDPRGELFREFCRIVREVRPRFFVLENVKGILSAAIQHRPLNLREPGNPPLGPDERLGSAFKLILKELTDLDYYVVYGVLNAADYGVPQKRWRVIVIGSRDGEEIRLPRPTHRHPEFLNGHKRNKPWTTLRSALENVDSKNWSTFSKDRSELLEQLEAGQNWRNLPKELHRKALGAAYDSWGGRGGFCRRLAWDEPAPTLTTAPDGRATTLCHPEEVRPLSVEEYAALQQFPPGWKFSGSVSQQYTQIGNGVPIGLGAAVGRMLRCVMRRTDHEGEMPLKKLRGHVVCGDDELAKRLTNRRVTQLNPPHLRSNSDPDEARRWLEASA